MKKSNHQLRKKTAHFCRIIVLCLFSVLFLFPFYWMLTTSLKMPSEIFKMPPKLLTWPVTFKHYAEAWNMQDTTRFLFNTLKIAFFAVFLGVLSSAVIAYGFARIRFKGRNVLFLLVLATMILPGEVLIIPQYMEFNYLGWLNTHLPLIVPAAFGNPFYIFLIRQYLKGIPTELDESALIDGCSRLQILTRILMPLLIPVLATCTIFQFMASWNDYLPPLMYLSTRDKWTLSLGIAALNSEKLYSSVNWGHRMAMATVFSAVPLVVFFMAQNQLIGGIATTGLKG